MYVNWCANHRDACLKKNIVVKHVKVVFKNTEIYRDFKNLSYKI